MNPKLKTAAVAVACLSLAIGITYAIAQAKDRNSPPRQGDDARAKPTCPKQNPDSNCPQGRDAKNVLKCPHCGTTLAMVVVGNDDRQCRQMDRRDDDGERPMMNRPGRGGDDERDPMMDRPGRGDDRGQQMDRRDGDDDRGPQMGRQNRMAPPMQRDQASPEDDFPMMMNEYMPDFPSMPELPQQ